MLIESDFSIRIIDLKHLAIQTFLPYPAATWSFMSATIPVSFSGIQTAFSLLHTIKGFLFHCKSTILQPLHAVSSLKDFQNNFDKNEKCSSPTICLEMSGELHVTSSKDLHIYFHCILLIRRRAIFDNHQLTKIKTLLFYFLPLF